MTSRSLATNIYEHIMKHLPVGLKAAKKPEKPVDVPVASVVNVMRTM